MAQASIEPSKKDMVTVAIDFGTHFMSYGYSSYANYNANIHRITPFEWSTGTSRTEMVVRLNPDNSVRCLGGREEAQLSAADTKELSKLARFENFLKDFGQLKDLNPNQPVVGTSGEKRLLKELIASIIWEIRRRTVKLIYIVNTVLILPFSDENCEMENFREVLSEKTMIPIETLHIVSQKSALLYYADKLRELEGKDYTEQLNKNLKDKIYTEGGNLDVLRGALAIGHDRVPNKASLSHEDRLYEELMACQETLTYQDILEVQKENAEKYKYDEEGPVEVTKEMLKNGLPINDTCSKLCFKEVTKSSKEIDSTEISKMVEDAKFGRWDVVWPILDAKPYLVNCIPEERTWSALHQAIYCGDMKIVEKLVRTYAADENVEIRADRDSFVKKGSNAISLADQLDANDIKNCLEKHKVCNKVDNRSGIIAFELHRNGDVFPLHKNPLLQITYASYTSTFLKDPQSPIDGMLHISHILEVIMSVSDKTWKDVKRKIYGTLYAIDTATAETLNRSANKNDFFKRIIRIYTEEDINVYQSLKAALMRQNVSPYRPIAEDLAVAPYAVMLSGILLKWKALEGFGGVTYRGVQDDVIGEHNPGETIVFYAFRFLEQADSGSRSIYEISYRYNVQD